MCCDSKEAPLPPDLIGAANAQNASALSNTRAATDANRIDQYTPLGNQIYYRGVGGDPDHWASRVTLSPSQQQQFTLNNAISANLLRQGNAGLNAVADATRHPFDTSQLPALQINPGQTAQDAIESRLNPMFDRQQSALDTQLANQGVARGSEAANNAYDDFGRQKNDAYMQAALQGINVGQDARQQSLQEQEFLRNEPLNMVNALRTGNQVSLPQFQQGGQQQTAPGANLLDATNSNYQNQLGQFNANAASQSNSMNGLFSLAASAAPLLLSDRRLKTNIVKIGEYHGHNVYEYDIFGEHKMGVMAQEVALINPDAVKVHRTGYMMVDYGAL